MFSASGMTIEFPGFLKVYVEDVEEDADDRQAAEGKGQSR
jgi:DNA topoisomerase IA